MCCMWPDRVHRGTGKRGRMNGRVDGWSCLGQSWRNAPRRRGASAAVLPRNGGDIGDVIVLGRPPSISRPGEKLLDFAGPICMSAQGEDRCNSRADSSAWCPAIEISSRNAESGLPLRAAGEAVTPRISCDRRKNDFLMMNRYPTASPSHAVPSGDGDASPWENEGFELGSRGWPAAARETRKPRVHSF